MTESIKLDLTDAVEAAARALAKAMNRDYDTEDPIMKLRFREGALISVNAAAPFIINQVIIDIASRTYEIQ